MDNIIRYDRGIHGDICYRVHGMTGDLIPVTCPSKEDQPVSERFHPNMNSNRVIVARDSFVWQTNDFDALYDHLEDVLADIVCASPRDLDRAAKRLRMLMCACTVAAERQREGS